MSAISRLLFACAVSAASLSIAFAAFMSITAGVDHVSVPRTAFVRLLPVVAGVGFAFQFIYGGLLQRLLRPRGMFRLNILLLAYIAPILVVGLGLANTFGDLVGLVPWLCFAAVTSTVFWLISAKGIAG